MTDTVPVHASVIEITPVNAGRILALATVEIEVSGLCMLIRGVQICRATTGGKEATTVNLPCYRAPSGAWESAVILPDELKGPLGDAVLAAAVEAGICKRLEPAD